MRALLPVLACTCILAVTALPARGQVAPFDEAALHAYVTQQAAAAGSQASRFEVQIGSVRPAALAPCRRTEPFLPTGVLPWGRSSVGVRCVDGAAWTLLVPVTVRAWGPALVAAGPLAVGSSPQPDEVRAQDVEITREGAGLLRELAQVQGRVLTRALAAGQPLRADQFRAPLVIQAGDPVRLRIVGAGFAITASGQALGAAADGQSLRVRSELGRILTGIAREGRTVDVAL